MVHLVYSIPNEYFRCCTSLILISWSIASFKVNRRGLFNRLIGLINRL